MSDQIEEQTTEELVSESAGEVFEVDEIEEEQTASSATNFNPILSADAPSVEVPKPKFGQPQNANDFGLDGQDADFENQQQYEETGIPEYDETYDDEGAEGIPYVDVEEVQTPFNQALSDLISTYLFEQGLPYLFYHYSKIDDKKAFDASLKYSDYDFDKLGIEFKGLGEIPNEIYHEILKKNKKIRKAYEPDEATKKEIRESLRLVMSKYKINKDVGPEGRLIFAIMSYGIQAGAVFADMKKENKLFEKKMVNKLDKFEAILDRAEKQETTEQKAA